MQIGGAQPQNLACLSPRVVGHAGCLCPLCVFAVKTLSLKPDDVRNNSSFPLVPFYAHIACSGDYFTGRHTDAASIPPSCRTVGIFVSTIRIILLYLVIFPLLSLAKLRLSMFASVHPSCIEFWRRIPIMFAVICSVSHS